jgi:hypothetical protein
MGTLVAMHYPTVLGLRAADHTYVMCGTGGKAWSCWGGKTGGSILRSGSGSTNQDLGFGHYISGSVRMRTNLTPFHCGLRVLRCLLRRGRGVDLGGCRKMYAPA